MNWYKHFFEQLKLTNEVFTPKDLYAALCIGVAESGFATVEDLRDLTKAYNEYMEVINNVRITSAV